MTLCDAGPLIAIIDADELDHDACPGIHRGDVPTRPGGGITGQRALWRLVHTNGLIVADPSTKAVERSAQLMDKHADRPMDLADATLVALAKEQGIAGSCLDSDFHIYRIGGADRRDVRLTCVAFDGFGVWFCRVGVPRRSGVM